MPNPNETVTIDGLTFSLRELGTDPREVEWRIGLSALGGISLKDWVKIKTHIDEYAWQSGDVNSSIQYGYPNGDTVVVYKYRREISPNSE